MIDKEYIKGIISGINKDKNEKKLVPYNASMQEIMEAVREDVLECMRNLCNDREISYNKTLNSVSFKCAYEKTVQSEQDTSIQPRPGTLDKKGSFLEGEGCL